MIWSDMAGFKLIQQFVIRIVPTEFKKDWKNTLWVIVQTKCQQMDSQMDVVHNNNLQPYWLSDNKANLTDLIAAIGLVILHKLDSNRRFFSVTLKFDGWRWKLIRHLFYTTSIFVHHFKAMSEFKLELQSGNTQLSDFFVLCDLKIWWMILKNNRAPLLCYIKLCCSKFGNAELKFGNAQFG